MSNYIVSVPVGSHCGEIVYTGKSRDEAFALAKEKSVAITDSTIHVREYSSFKNFEGVICGIYTFVKGEVKDAITHTLFLEDLAMLANSFAESG